MIPRETFYPKSVAIVGASSNEQKEKLMWTGRLQQFGYSGRLYPINPRAPQILDCKAYPSIKDIPEPVDYAIISITAEFVPQVMKECIDSGVKVVHIFAAGFAETGKEKGKELQAELQSIIRGGKTRVIGPNCMGIYCPASGMTFNIRFPREAGTVGVISQTGAGLQGFIPQADKREIRFSKAISYGNGIDLEAADFLEFLAEDPETKLIFCYTEGLRDGRHFFEAARKCMERNKPLIILKAGLTEGGRGAVASHTASIAGSEKVWQGFFKQTRCVSVETLEEGVNQIVAFQYLKPPRGKAVGIVTRGGGVGVIATDQCERNGLSVPALNIDTKKELEKITPAEAGSSIRNPVEIGFDRSGVSKHYAEGIKLVASDPNVNILLVQINPHFYIQYGVTSQQIEEAVDVLVNTAKEISKPMAAVIPVGDTADTIEPVLRAQTRCLKGGLAVFSDMEVAIKAVSKLVRYYTSLTA